MQTLFEQIHSIPVDEILNSLWIEYKINWVELELFDKWNRTDWWRCNTQKWIFKDFSGKRAEWNRFTFVQKHLNLDNKGTIEWFKTNFHITIPDTPKHKHRKRAEYIENPPTEDSPLPILRRFLEFRWFSYKQLTKYEENIKALSHELYAESRFFVSANTYKDTLFFPMYDENKQRTGLKMRTVDWTEFNTTWKSGNIAGGKSGCIYSQIDEDQVIIVEGEVDYLTLKTLGFKSVIGNLWGISACKSILKDLCKNTKRIIVAYDNDEPGRNAKLDFWRPHEVLAYPDDTEGCDVTDLMKRGFDYHDFRKMFVRKPLPLLWNRFFFNKTNGEFYDTLSHGYLTKQKIAEILLQETKIITKPSDIFAPIYEWICYREGGKEGYYNLFDSGSLLQRSNNPVIAPDLDFLINNLCNYNKENIDWLLSAIAHKYENINSVRIPAVLFFWPWATGKWLFVKLLAKIFWKENCLEGMNQNAIEWRFSPDTSCKLIVEYKELVTSSTSEWKKTMNKLKSMFMEETISLEKKWQDIQTIENIAWNILSSNDQRAIVLDSSFSGNRRFAIIKTSNNKIDLEKGRIIEDAINNHSQDFLAYILDNYGWKKFIEALSNKEKSDLEYLSESYSTRFFNWLQDRYPDINRLTNYERNILIVEYDTENGDWNDFRDTVFYRNFNNWLPLNVEVASFIINKKTHRWYVLKKQWRGFTDEEIYNLTK